jgi:hypothetical protein
MLAVARPTNLNTDEMPAILWSGLGIYHDLAEHWIELIISYKSPVQTGRFYNITECTIL